MATNALRTQNFFQTTLSSSISASDTTIPLNAVPTGTEGYLIIEPDSSTNREIIYYTSKTGSGVTLPSAGAGRGQDGTSAASHSSGATVKMHFVSAYWDALRDGSALANGSIGPNKLATGALEALVATSEATTSTSFTDLTTTTDTVTVTIGANGLALVTIAADMSNSAATGFTYVGFAISGATTVAANDNRALKNQSFANNGQLGLSGAFLVTGLTPGSTTFKLKYRVNGSTGTFLNRRIGVVPL